MITDQKIGQLVAQAQVTEKNQPLKTAIAEAVFLIGKQSY